MEQNITKQQTGTINVAIYSNTAQTDLANKLLQFIAPDGREAREFAFEVKSLNAAINSQDALSIIFEHTNDNEAKKVAQFFENNGLPHIIAVSDEINETAKNIILSLEKALDSGFTVADFIQIYNQGTSIDALRRQLTIFRNGLSRITLEKPALLNDGICPIDEEKAIDHAAYFDSKKDNFKLKKFVPASGAASRMFKFACTFIAEYNPAKETINAYINRRGDTALSVFLVGIDKLPFYNEVLAVMKTHPDYNTWDKNLRYYNFIKTMLGSGEFDFANKPKGILPFHQYEGFTATPVYEHLKEAVAYAASQGKTNVHFTISEEHVDGFLDAIKAVKSNIEASSGISINFNFSYQHKQTDTLAVDLNNNPFRTDTGELLFRPGGHGALIENLNNLDADIVFIKNIDNVSHNNIEVIALYKKALAGMLIKLQEKIFGYLEIIDGGHLTDAQLNSMFAFVKNELSVQIPDDVAKYTKGYRIDYIKDLLNRPLRVCGMVKNEGEPGGGPFWIKGEQGRLSLQIVESSQIDLQNPAQKQIFEKSEFFNPVDLVCGLKNYKGEYFDLHEYVDNSTGFIVYKNKYGKDLKSYELPGLWNGAMARWLTVFAEVPLATFNPVKTVNDLLKPAHQPK
ncbi:DUF4301 family protein [Flavobacterium sp. J372]|uniref:DUF4301 family protein n=1 Tax=Flavobacterium sp. J372 TaxID=2898436 RepID=UPI0021514D73|nr:DUF4301 family protein [Flavobacterium sp. J372]MCR5860869.1 DUF4301 family protein [Flavobacterium sp. J372]